MRMAAAEIVHPRFEARQITWQPGCDVSLILPGEVLKRGRKVRPSEAAAMRLVQKHAPNIPIPRIHGTYYKYQGGIPCYGELYMEYMPGKTLSSIWPELDTATKDRVCQDIWDIVAQLRTIPRPDDLAPGHYRTVDGSPCCDVLVGDNNDVAPPVFDDDTLRNRIYCRYVAKNGLSYKDETDVRELLPHSNTSVFCHGDIGPRNIIVDDGCRITALLDWESSGWFPDYWEYSQMMKYCDPAEYEWQDWMVKFRPEPWDITGIEKAWRVLF